MGVGRGWEVDQATGRRQQTVRQDARRTVREALESRRSERLAAERRQADLAVNVLATLAKRDAAIAAADEVAAAGVRALIAEGLDLADIHALCGGAVPLRDLQRLAKLPGTTNSASREAS